ncbi:MAG: AraC family transcriptional regulator [Cyanobacteria bacterium P01_F01_bin.86]
MEPTESLIRPDSEDALDVMTQFSNSWAEGYCRHIQLRDGLELITGSLRMPDRAQEKCPEGLTDGIGLHLHLSGEHQDRYRAIEARQYGIDGTGMVRETTIDYLNRQPFVEVSIWMRVDVLRSFVGRADGELPVGLQHLVRPMDQEFYAGARVATPTMLAIAQQIVQCPRQGLAKRMVLESKTLELLGLALEEEIIRHDDRYDGKQLPDLKPDTVDCIYAAREILRQRLDNPPSLTELARLVGLNECTLKQGFRQVFQKTVFGYWHDYSMEQAQNLLQTGDLKVEEVARMVGYRDRTAFTKAFRRKFGISPRDCKSAIQKYF